MFINESRTMFKKLFLDSVLLLLVALTLTHFSELHAGQTYYYDSKGNLISEEEYEKLVRKNNGQKGSSTAKGEGSEVSNQPAGEDSFVGKEPQLETEEDDEEMEEDDEEMEKDDEEIEEDDEEIEEDDIEALYQVEISSETIFRAFERDRGKQDDSVLVPAYQYLRLDLGALDEGGLSLHMYGWGRYDFNDSDHFDNNPDGELLYGYLEYNLPDYGTNFTLGRQHVMAGIINNSIDGLGVKSTLTPYFKYALYGGSPVGLSSEGGRSGDSFWGGRVAGHKAAEYEIGLSYKKKKAMVTATKKWLASTFLRSCRSTLISSVSHPIIWIPLAGASIRTKFALIFTILIFGRFINAIVMKTFLTPRTTVPTLFDSWLTPVKSFPLLAVTSSGKGSIR